MQDLEKEFQERKARQTGQPESLWQELYAIGEEFVEFLEHEASGLDKKGQARHAETTKAARYCTHLSSSRVLNRRECPREPS